MSQGKGRKLAPACLILEAVVPGNWTVTDQPDGYSANHLQTSFPTLEKKQGTQVKDG